MTKYEKKIQSNSRVLCAIHYTAALVLSIGLDCRFTLGRCHIDPPHRLAGVSSLLVRFQPRKKEGKSSAKERPTTVDSVGPSTSTYRQLHTIYIVHIQVHFLEEGNISSTMQQRFRCAFDFLWMGKILLYTQVDIHCNADDCEIFQWHGGNHYLFKSNFGQQNRNTKFKSGYFCQITIGNISRPNK